MKIKPKRALISIGLIGLVLFLVIVSLDTTGNYSVQLNSLDGVTNSDIILHFKSATGVIDQNGNTRIADHSPFFSASPALSLIDPETGRTTSNFFHFVAVRANTGIDTIDPNNYQECLEQPDQPNLCQATNAGQLVIKPTTLTLKIFSKDSKNNLVETYSQDIITREIKLNSGKEQRLCDKACFQIPVNSILRNLDQGTYDSLQEFRVSGQFSMHYEGFNFPSVTYDVAMSENKIPTFITMKVADNKLGKPVGGTDTTDDPQEDARQNDQNVDEVDNLESLGRELYSCATLFDIECLDQIKFGGFYAIGIVLAGIIVISKLSKNKNNISGIEIGAT